MATRTSIHRRRRVAVCRSVAALLLLALILGCSAQKHYKTLSFFFDGVPDPNADALATTRNVSRGGKQHTVYIHKPYAENNCNACHEGDRQAFFTLAAAQGPKPERCLTCHADVPHKHAVMHGPVAVNACNWCHSPHQSLNPHLLKSTPNKVCMQCHGPTGLSPSLANHQDPKSNCLDCHSGHGGDRSLLKPGWVAMQTPRGGGDGAGGDGAGAGDTEPNPDGAAGDGGVR